MTGGAMRLASLAAFLAVLSIWSLLMADTKTEKRVPMEVKLRLLESLPGMLARNDTPQLQVQAMSTETRDSGVLIPVARAGEKHANDPSALILTYDAKGCPITFPAGRQMQISFEGPVIDDAYLIYPMEVMTWDEMQRMVADTVDLFELAGWPVKKEPRFGPPTEIRREITPEELNKKSYGTKTVTIGVWSPCDAPHVEAYAEVRHLNSSPTGTSIPPKAAELRDPEAPDRFVMRVKFWIDNEALSKEIIALRDARRAEMGAREQAIAAQVWLDDPDWRPEGWEGRWIE